MKSKSFKGIAQVGLINVIRKEYLNDPKNHNIYHNDYEVRDMMFWCIDNNKIDYVKYFLGTNIDVNNILYRTWRDVPYLSYAINENKYEIAKLLIEHGANIFYDKSEALRIAVNNNNNKIVKLLVDNGMDLLSKDAVRLFYHKIIDKNYKAIKILLKNGMKLDDNLIKEILSETNDKVLENIINKYIK